MTPPVKPHIALLAYEENAPTETFVRAHKKYIDGIVEFLYGGNFPKHSEKNGYILKQDKGRFMWLKLMSLFGRKINWDNESHNALPPYFKQQKFDLVYAEYGPVACGILNTCRELNIPLVVNFHGYDVYNKKVVEQNSENYKALFKYASRVVAVSTHMKTKLVDFGCSPDKIIYTPCAPNDRFFSLNPSFWEKTFITIGSFNDKKAPFLSILAFSEVIKQIPEARMNMLGTGEYLDACRMIVRGLKLENKITFHGSCTPETVADLLEKSSCFVQHSVTPPSGDSEGTPVAVLEAGAAALPVVSTKHTGINDVVQEGTTGFLVDEFDISAMADRMIKVISDLEFAKKIGLAAREHVRNHYSMERHMTIINGAIREVLKK